MTISSDVRGQAGQAIRDIGAAPCEADSAFDVVSVRYFRRRAADLGPCWPVLRRTFKDVRSAGSMIAAGPSDRRMKIEIEVTAHRSSATVVLIP